MIRIRIVLCLAALAAACKESPYESSEPIKPMREYTRDNAREWTDIAKYHAPRVTRTSNQGTDSVLVEVPLEKADEGHYIEKIGIMDLTGRELASQSIKRQRNPITYVYFDAKIIPWQGRIKGFAKCNKHDLWVREVPVSELGF